jgi:hypothetical protein
MPEASARRLTDGHRHDLEPAPARLRVVRGGRDSRASDSGDDAFASDHARRAAGRPHPRSRLRPEAAPGARLLEDHEARVAAGAGPRTIVVTGQRAAAPARSARRGEAPSHRRRSPSGARTAARPDRLALWAVGLGLLMAFMAAATAQADVDGSSAAPAAAVVQR